MSIILNSISVTAAFVFGIGVIYFLLDYIFGNIKLIQSKNKWYGFQVKDLVMIIFAIVFILSTVNFVKPY